MRWIILAIAIAFGNATAAFAEAQRLVLVKLDGVPGSLIERYVGEIDPRTGRSRLPWIKQLFWQEGTRLENFYVRGVSLSAPSWAALDTGRHAVIKGNVEYDRYTLRTHDYLHAVGFYINYARKRRVDMPAVEVIDDAQIPLFSDLFPYQQRYQSLQLFARGGRLQTLERTLRRRMTPRSIRGLIGEWQTGLEMEGVLYQQIERELIGQLADSQLRYLDLFLPEFDHVAHLTNDPPTQFAALKRVDDALGRIWAGIQASPLADDTVLVVVSDHGLNTHPKIYSQGYSLPAFLNSAAGGAHHVVMNRHALADYKVRSLNPFVGVVVAPSRESPYLDGQAKRYPTAQVDLDGNERAAIWLRDSDLNVLQILWRQLQRRDLEERLRQAAAEAFFETIERRRAGWERTLADLEAELDALERTITRQEAVVRALPRRGNQEDRAAGRPREWRRQRVRLESRQANYRDYTQYARSLKRLLALRLEKFDAGRVSFESIVPPRVMGDHNSVHRLRNYVIGPASGGLALTPDGVLDTEAGFRRVDYFSALTDIQVRNQPQPEVSHRPIDFVAVRLQPEAVTRALDGKSSGARCDDAVWVYAGEHSQLLILGRRDEADTLRLRVVPLASLTEEADGALRIELSEWREGLPLELWEDPNLTVPGGDRRRWLGLWHSDVEWLRATHRTRYSNAAVSLHEHFSRAGLEVIGADAADEDEALVARFERRRRKLAEADLLVLANNHWNFNARGFNPGGNHGSFFHASTHSVLMFTGGASTGIPSGLAITEPYDSLSLAPTLAELLGIQPPRPFPGRVIQELVPAPHHME